MKPRLSLQNAFTLIELLVVLGIILVLLVLAVPVFNGPQNKARTVVCMSRLKQINVGIQMYLEDQLNKSPGNTNAARSPFLSWTDYRGLISDYVGVKHAPSSDDYVFACPADSFYYAMSSKDRPVTLQPLHEQSNYVFTSYAYNAGMATTRPTTNSLGTITPGTTNFYGIAGMRLESIAYPARTVLIAETPAYAPYSWHQPKKPFSEQNSKFNDSKNVVGFVDGHVSYIKMHYDGNHFAWATNPPAKYDYQWTGD